MAEIYAIDLERAWSRLSPRQERPTADIEVNLETKLTADAFDAFMERLEESPEFKTRLRKLFEQRIAIPLDPPRRTLDSSEWRAVTVLTLRIGSRVEYG